MSEKAEDLERNKMTMAEQTIWQHPFLAHLDKSYRNTFNYNFQIENYKSGEYLFREGRPSHQFFLINKGKLVLEIHCSPQGPISLQTLGPGEAVGWSWFFPPHVWTYDGKAQEEMEVFSLNGIAIKEECEKNCGLGYEMIKRISKIMIDRLQQTRLRLTDMYGNFS